VFVTVTVKSLAFAEGVIARSVPISSGDEHVLVDGAPGAFLLDAVQFASRLTSGNGSSREVSLFLLRVDLLTCVATSRATDAPAFGPYRVADRASFHDAITSREITIGPENVLVPVQAEGAVLGLLMLAGDRIPHDDERDVWLGLAGLMGFGISQAATVDELQEEAERSRGLERLKGEFLNIAAHELRSPLGIIRGYASMLSEGMLPEGDRGTALARIAEKAEEMARLISDMLETARLETLGLELELEPVDLVRVMDAAIEEMRPLLGDNHRFALAERRDAIAVVADQKRLTTMVGNLIDNAIKYSPAGGDIEVDCDHDGTMARVTVRDHGIGINAEQAHMLFTRFGRLVIPETSHIRGTGLGLYVARETARLHGGDVQVSSTIGGGSTFTVVLPLA
jgi:signal transduction histidine kinase